MRVELALLESAGVTLRLSRTAKTKAGKRVVRVLASKRFGTLRAADDRLLTLLVPRRIARGRALLAIVLTDAAGNVATFRRNVTVARA